VADDRERRSAVESTAPNKDERIARTSVLYENHISDTTHHRPHRAAPRNNNNNGMSSTFTCSPRRRVVVFYARQVYITRLIYDIRRKRVYKYTRRCVYERLKCVQNKLQYIDTFLMYSGSFDFMSNTVVAARPE